MRIFVDGTESFWRPENRTGIQRVVREVCRRCEAQAPAGTEVIPVQFDGRRWGLCGETGSAAYRAFALARQLASRCRALRRLSRARWKASPWRLWLSLSLLGGLFGSAIGSACASLMRLPLRASSAPEMRVGDTLLMLDYPSRRLGSVDAVKAAGVRLVVVIYDCVPLSHPQFYRLEKEFAVFFEWSLANAEGIMTISAFSEAEIRARLPAIKPWVDHFHLGADFAQLSSGAPRPALVSAFGSPCYLMVGTIAPHKNHSQALTAMEQHWQSGGEAHLLIVGKVGWQADDFLGRIAKHPELGRKLFVFHDLDDDELAYAYARSQALVAASYVEGFGLPLVEALGRGLPVLASDIPVFREIGGQAVEFFPLEDASALAALVGRWSAQARRKVEGWKWLNWDQSTRHLLSKVQSRLIA